VAFGCRPRKGKVFFSDEKNQRTFAPGALRASGTWRDLSARGRSITYLGVALPRLIGRDRSFAETLISLHGALATIMRAVIGLHATAALADHVILRDPTLRRMLKGQITIKPKGPTRSVAGVNVSTAPFSPSPKPAP
jgi:hypothetical protein